MRPLSESSTNDNEVEISPSPDHERPERFKKCTIKSPRKRAILICVVTAMLAAGVGVLLGYFVPILLKDSCDVQISSVPGDVDDKFANEVSAEELENNLR